jgi:hypothetical protein
MSYDLGRRRLNGLIDRVNDRNTYLLMRVLGRSRTVRSSSILIADLPPEGGGQVRERFGVNVKPDVDTLPPVPDAPLRPVPTERWILRRRIRDRQRHRCRARDPPQH